MAAAHPVGVFVTDTRGAREYDAHLHVAQVFTQLRAKNALLEERSRQQGEQFLRLQQRRWALQQDWAQLRAAGTELSNDKHSLRSAMERRWASQGDGGRADSSASLPYGSTAVRGFHRVVLDVGGQVFETTMATLCKEPQSLLARTAFHHVQSLRRADARAAAAGEARAAAVDASTASEAVVALGGESGAGAASVAVERVETGTQVPEPRATVNPLSSESSSLIGTGDRSLFIDRDWWIFRYILQYLRDGPPALPTSTVLLKQMFREAQHWQLTGMQAAVEEAYQRALAVERARGVI